MNEKGLVAAFTGVRRPFQLANSRLREPAPGTILVEVRLANVCGSDLHIRAASTTFARSQSLLPLDRPRNGRADRRPWRRGGAGLCGSAAASRRPSGVPVLLSLRRVSQLPQRHDAPLPARPAVPPAADGNGRTLTQPTDSIITCGRRKPSSKCQTTCPTCWPGRRTALSQVIDGLERAQVEPGDTLVIQGAGGLGINAVAVAKERGVTQVIVIDGIESRLALATEFGADATIDLNECKTPATRVARVRELTDGEGADAVMELVGSAAIVAEGIEMLCSGGVYLEIGNVNQRLACELNPANSSTEGRRFWA